MSTLIMIFIFEFLSTKNKKVAVLHQRGETHTQNSPSLKKLAFEESKPQLLYHSPSPSLYKSLSIFCAIFI
jgi:hypothetical protein